MKLLRKIGDLALRALILCAVVTFWLVGGWLVGTVGRALIIFPFFLIGADALGRRLAGLLPDSQLLSTAIGMLAILCYRVISHAWKRKRVIEEEIKIVSRIQIREPPPPARLQRFFSKGGPPDRLFNRCFGWIENIENEGVRFVVGFMVWAVLALALGGVVMWLERARGLLRNDITLWEIIFFAFLYGSVLIFIALVALAGMEDVTRKLPQMCGWLAKNLARGVVFRYRQWQLRRMARRQHRRGSSAS